MLDGQCLIREVGPYRTSRFQSCSVIEVNSGEQREFRLDSCPDNHSRRSYIYAYVLEYMDGRDTLHESKTTDGQKE